MKKFLIMASMLLFIVPANAYYVTSPSFGGYNSMNSFSGNRRYNDNYNFGSNAAFLPQNIQRASMQQRQIEYERKYLDSLKNTQNVNVNINGNGLGYPPPPPPSVTTYHYPNGYTNTYYNNGYNRYYNNGRGTAYRTYNYGGNTITFPGLRMY